MQLFTTDRHGINICGLMGQNIHEHVDSDNFNILKVTKTWWLSQVEPWTHLILKFKRKSSPNTYNQAQTMQSIVFQCNCHLYFWQNDWALLHAIVTTQGRNGYLQQRKLTLKMKIPPLLVQGVKPVILWWWSSYTPTILLRPSLTCPSTRAVSGR